MSVLKGNTSGSFTSPIQLQTYRIENFIITNKSAGSVTINLSIVKDGNAISICPINLQLSVGQSYADRNYEIELGESILLTVSDNVDYYFLINI